MKFIFRQLFWDGFVPREELKHAEKNQNSGLNQDTENKILRLIQEREFQILVSNDLKLHSFNGLDTLHMILKHSNEDFNFRPLLFKTEELLFCNKSVNEWVLHQLVSRFDNIYLIFAAFIIVCCQNEFKDFVSELNLLLIKSDILIDFPKLDNKITAMKSLLN